MEFKSLTNIESSFRRIRLMLAVFTGCCALITGYALWSSYRFAEKQREKIYVLDKGKSLMLAPLAGSFTEPPPPRRGEHVRRSRAVLLALPAEGRDRAQYRPCPQLADKSAITTMWTLPKRDY